MKIDNKIIAISQGATTDKSDQLNTLFKIVNGFKLGFDFASLSSHTGNAVGTAMNSFPAKYTVSCLWEIDKPLVKKETVQIEARILDPSNAQLGETNVNDLVIETGSDNFWVHMVSQVLHVTKPGYYHFEVKVKSDGQTISSVKYRFKVELEDIKAAGV